VLSATAVECELARLFIKWKRNDVIDTRLPTQAEVDAWAEQWRKWNSIATRLDKASALLIGEDFDSFLSQNPGLLKSVHDRYPSSKGCSSPKDFFIKEFFYKRNKIVHTGEIDFQQPDGEMCFTLAAALFQIMREMDKLRI
jgi:hypothetical protein